MWKLNFVEILEKGIYVRTFERGVEEETLSCGTGVTASAIASVLAGQIDTNPVSVITKGGNLSVSFKIDGKSITDIWLSGPATFVFEGMIKIWDVRYELWVVDMKYELLTDCLKTWIFLTIYFIKKFATLDKNRRL